MKYLQKITALVLALMLFAAMAPTVFATENDAGVEFTEVQETVYAITDVNVRTGPGTHFNVITMLHYGDSVHRIGVGANGWSKVLYNNEIAYMYTNYVTTEKPAKIDYSQLSQQIAIASGLREVNYTAESWAVLTEAVDAAKEAMKSDNQDAVDKSYKALREALDQLVSANRSALQKALDNASDFTSSNEKNNTWFELIKAIDKGRLLLGSNDQAAIDAAAAELEAILGQVSALVKEQETPKVVTQEVPVEVPPTDDYCNIPKHRTWPVLFFCSLAVNVALIAVIAVYVSKKKNQKDNTPLVDYDISDDIY